MHMQKTTSAYSAHPIPAKAKHPINSLKICLALFLLIAFITGACGFHLNIQIDQGSGNVVTEQRTVQDFDRVLLNGIGDIILQQGSPESLQIDAEDNVLPRIKTEISEGILRISLDDKTVIPTKPIKYRLTMNTIHSLETQGVSSLQADKLVTDHLELGIGGTGVVTIRNLHASQLVVNVSGAGNLTTAGEVTEQRVSLSGAGNYTSQDLQCKTAKIAITGLGRVTTWVTESLDVTISGTGSVDYYGNPQVSQQISGLGKLTSKGER